jgi:hypothetical protein
MSIFNWLIDRVNEFLEKSRKAQEEAKELASTTDVDATTPTPVASSPPPVPIPPTIKKEEVSNESSVTKGNDSNLGSSLGIYNPTGELSSKYEGKVGTIANNPKDPGGKSYGCWQLSLNAGTLDAYVKQSKYKTRLTGAKLASDAFDKAWKQLAIDDPKGFKEDQYDYIKKSLFDPAFDYWKKDCKGSLHPAIVEVLWSMSVQHGGVKKILLNASLNIRKFKSTVNYRMVIDELYNERERYVKKYLQGSILKSVLDRYKSERKDALAML